MHFVIFTNICTFSSALVIFHFFICSTEPMFNTSETNKSFPHSLHKNNFCRRRGAKLSLVYQVTDTKRPAFKRAASKPYSIYFLYARFTLLLHKRHCQRHFQGEIFEKLEQAFIYNHYHELNLCSSQRKLPIV